MGTPTPPRMFPQNKNMGKNVIPKGNRKSKLKCVCIMYETSIPLCFRTPSPNGTTRRLYINIFLVRNVKKDFYYAMFRGVWGLFRLRLPLYFGPYSVFPAPVFQNQELWLQGRTHSLFPEVLIVLPLLMGELCCPIERISKTLNNIVLCNRN